MNRFTKVSLALATAGGAMMFSAAPMAFASINLSAAGSAQCQNGTGSSGNVLDQSSSVSAGGISAENYYNSTTNNGFTGTQTTYNNQNEYSGNDTSNNPVAVSSDTTTNHGGSSWTKATDFSSQGASANLSQSQNIDNSGLNNGWGSNQFGVSGAVSGSVGDGLVGGAALSVQEQNGNNASSATLNQTSNVQAGLTSADKYQYDTKSNGFTDSTSTWNAGSLTTSQNVTNYGGSSYTKADDYLNPVASSTQDQSQNIADNGNGGTQHQGQVAVTGQVGSGFWGQVASASYNPH